MTTRNEPTVGTTDIFSFFNKKDAKTPDQLVVDALQGFTDAQAKLGVAQAAIAAQKADHEAEIEKRTKLLEAATESHSRLDRIKGRFADMLA